MLLPSSNLSFTTSNWNRMDKKINLNIPDDKVFNGDNVISAYPMMKHG